MGHENSQQYHVFELTRQLPKFSMYAIREDFLSTSVAGKCFCQELLPEHGLDFIFRY